MLQRAASLGCSALAPLLPCESSQVCLGRAPKLWLLLLRPARFCVLQSNSCSRTDRQQSRTGAGLSETPPRLREAPPTPTLCERF